jgi:HlyD family secretion protein
MQVDKAHSFNWLLPLIIFSSGGIAVWQWVRWSEAPVQLAQTQQIQARPVETIKLTSGRAVQKIQLLGQVEASEKATIRTQVNGLVKQVLVKAGDRLGKGQIVALLDDSDQQLAVFEAQAHLAGEKSQLARLEMGTRSEIIAQRQAQLNAAKAKEKEAQDNLRRVIILTQEGALSERDLVQAKTEAYAAVNERLRIEAILTQAEAGPTSEEIEAQRRVVQAAEVALQKAQLDLQRTTITVDFPGVVQSRDVSVGEYVENGDPIITLVNVEELDVFLEVPEKLIGQIPPGFPVELTARAIPGWKQKVKVSAVVPITDTTTRRQLVRVSLSDPPPELLPGMAIEANVTLNIRSDQPIFTIPRNALTRRDDQWLIFVVNKHKVKQYAVELLADMGSRVAITHQDLQGDEEIVVTGGDGLRNGSKVRVISSETE